MRDQSGLEPTEQDWVSLADQPESLRSLLKEIGRMYAPAQLANARAVQAGAKAWDAEIDGAPALKHPYANGTTHFLFEPLDLIAKLAALVPRPRVNLTRYHGYLHQTASYEPGLCPVSREKSAATSLIPRISRSVQVSRNRVIQRD